MGLFKERKFRISSSPRAAGAPPGRAGPRAPGKGGGGGEMGDALPKLER